MKRIYFDNAATTAPHYSALAAFSGAAGACGNPSSLHGLGLEAEKLLSLCAEELLARINGAGDVIFTSGATEANNLALFGYLRPYRGKNVVTSAIEHPSVLECIKELNQRGYEMRIIQTDEYGRVCPDKIAEAIDGNTAIVSVQHVNSELGTIQRIEEIGRAIKRVNKNVIFHTDAAQSLGKLEIDTARAYIDLLSVSAHKLHGVQGVGALYVRKGVVVQPLIFGGGQQKNVRSGTENVPGIAAFREALSHKPRHPALKAYIAECLKGAGIAINSPDDSSPYILNISFIGAKSELFMRALEERGIYVSAGSACSSKRKSGAVLTACGLTKERIESAIRLSFSEYNTLEEADVFIHAINEILPVLRSLGGKNV